MKLSYLSLRNIKCFRGKTKIDLSPSINLFVGHNNSGKSTILNAIYQIQNSTFSVKDKSIDSLELPEITIGIMSENEKYIYNNEEIIFTTRDNSLESPSNAFILFTLGNPQGGIRMTGKRPLDTNNIDDFLYNMEPRDFYVKNKYTNNSDNNLIFPFFSNKKVRNYSRKVGKSESKVITGDLINVYAKVDQLTSHPSRQSNIAFKEACVDILGFSVGTEYSDDEDGKHIALIVNETQSIHIDQLGAGIISLLGIIVDVCLAQNKIFIIEEPENDIHPKALKALLELFVKCSTNNQFFISTHSNVVLRHLGSSEHTNIFQIKSETNYDSLPILPTSTIRQITTPEERIDVLYDLGYELTDSELWTGWLFLEEYSAMTIIEDFLIPNFIPNLKGKLRVCFSSGFGNITRRFNSFNDLFIFIHLTDLLYKDKAWVLIDAGNDEKAVIDKLKIKYSGYGWKEDRFLQLSKHDFEEYYPRPYAERFHHLLAQVEAEPNPDKKQQMKKVGKECLLKDIQTWYRADKDQAITSFAESAKEVIDILKDIEQALS